MDISSVIVGARLEGAQQVKLLPEALDGVEVHAVADDRHHRPSEQEPP